MNAGSLRGADGAFLGDLLFEVDQILDEIAEGRGGGRLSEAQDRLMRAMAIAQEEIGSAGARFAHG